MPTGTPPKQRTHTVPHSDRNSSHLWHPFSHMGRVAGREVVIERAEGVWLWDETGRRYLDGTSSLWYANVGHGRQCIIDAVAKQLARPLARAIGLSPPLTADIGHFELLRDAVAHALDAV